MQISGKTTPFAVLGHPIGHSLSPVMHNAALAELGMDAVYLAFDVAPEHLMHVLPAMGNMGFGGVNLTVPLKEVASGGIENRDVSARRLGAVNTVEFTVDGSLKGHNTDGDGFIRALEEAFGAGPAGLSVFILGCGGAGRAVAITSAAEGADRVVLADAEPARASRVREEICEAFAVPHGVNACPADPASWARECRQADLVIQATPVGMKKEDVSLLGPEAFCGEQRVMDLVYMYPDTGFTRTARERGAKTVNGIGMLLHQGAGAFAIWTGKEPPIKVMRKALEDAVYGS